MSGQPKKRNGKARILLNITSDEAQWVGHAAKLVDLTRREYIVRAINAQLRHEGVDAVLIKQSDWD